MAKNQAVGGSPTSVVVADFDGDNALDIVTGNPDGGSISILKGAGDGTFLQQITMAEFGDPDDPKQWEFIRTFSPYHNVKRDAKYPRTLFTTSTRDDAFTRGTHERWWRG